MRRQRYHFALGRPGREVEWEREEALATDELWTLLGVPAEEVASVQDLQVLTPMGVFAVSDTVEEALGAFGRHAEDYGVYSDTAWMIFMGSGSAAAVMLQVTVVAEGQPRREVALAVAASEMAKPLWQLVRGRLALSDDVAAVRVVGPVDVVRRLERLGSGSSCFQLFRSIWMYVDVFR